MTDIADATTAPGAPGPHGGTGPTRTGDHTGERPGARARGRLERTGFERPDHDTVTADATRDVVARDVIAGDVTDAGPDPAARPALRTRMHHYFEASADTTPDAVALRWEGGEWTYAELDARANQVAHVLLETGARPGGRVGLFLPRTELLYAVLLGALKAGCAFVPIDPQTPADRLHYFASDAAVDVLVTGSELLDVCTDVPAPVLAIDTATDRLDAAPSSRVEVAETGDPGAYVIYTSGSTGLPKGVDVAQSSICNFLYEITHLYDVRPGDRVYQGMTISFDFAIEEVWPTWAAGATLVVGPTDGRRIGEGLTTFLEDQAITLLYCVPTVLATVERDIASIRGLMVGGEACPRELVERWSPGRRMLNTYGPTEATVTCTVGELLPGRAVTIGVPVPSYTALILDEQRRPVPDGQDGELAIGGIGVARGYLNRPELTADRFIAHPTDPAAGRIYRTGDLARIQEDGEIVYLGRADAEVKIRGHRVDLGEIESVMMRDPLVPVAAVKHLTSGPPGGELAAYLVLGDAAGAGLDGDAVIARVVATMREVLPPYMIPAFAEVVDGMPMLPSGKVDRKSLPDPSTPRLISGGPVVAPSTAMAAWVRDVWADTLGVDAADLSVAADFFTDLGGHSLLAATVTSRLRTDERGAGMSVMDLYSHPSIEALADHLSLRSLDHDEPREQVVARPRAPRPSGLRVAAFGAAQLALLFAFVLVAFAPVSTIYWYHDGRPSLVMLEHLAIAFPLTYLAGRWLLPLLIVRVASLGLREGEYPLFGWTHLRVWTVEKAMTISPLNNLAGSAFIAGYLRLAGARVDEATHIGTTQIPLPTMVQIGAGASVGYAAHLQGYDLRGGVLTIGQVRLEERATAAAQSVLVGPVTLGAGSYLAPQSTLPTGTVTGPGQSWVGSPATLQETNDDEAVALMQGCSQAPTRWSSHLKQRFVGGLIALELTPLIALLPAVLLIWWALVTFGDLAGLIATAATGVLFVVGSCVTILWLRRFGLPVTPVGVRHLRSGLGVDKWFADRLLETSLLLTNTLYATLYTPWWLRRLGARIGRGAEVSTIANIDPDLLTIGDESFVADMASVGGATYCNHHVAFRPTTVGTRAFVGNASYVPAGTDLGDGSLLGVGSVPPPGGVPAGTSWLGSPSFFLPRREVFDDFGEDVTFRPRRRQVIERYAIEALRIVLPSTLLALSTFGTLWLTSRAAEANWSWPMMLLAAPVAAVLCSLATVLVVAAIKWVVVGRYRPRVEPLWGRFVRRTEFVTGVYEAAAVPILYAGLTGTPLMGPALRLLGVRVGARSLVCTTYLTEFDLVHLGDDVVVHPEVSLQTHLFEDRVMKMNTIDIGDRVDVGTRAVVLYSTHVGDDARLSHLSLVMKGESLPPATRWSGIPAQQDATIGARS